MNIQKINKLNWYISAVVSGFVLACALLTFVFNAMDVKQFIEKVKKMRQHQNAYWRQGRKTSDLIAAKELEKEVDRALAEGIVFVDGGDATLTHPSPMKGEGDVVQDSLFE